MEKDVVNLAITAVGALLGGGGVWGLLWRYAIRPYLESANKERIQNLETRQKQLELTIEKERADIVADHDMSENFRRLIGVLESFASKIDVGIEKLVTSNINTEKNINVLVKEMPAQTDRRVGEVIKAVGTNGKVLTELIQKLLEEVAELKTEVNRQGAMLQRMETYIEKTEPLTPPEADKPAVG